MSHVWGARPHARLDDPRSSSDPRVYARDVLRPSAPMQALSAALPSPVLRDVSIRGVRVRFVEAGAGPAVVLVHGSLASHSTWDAVIPELATSFHVIAPDLPGFGESEKPSPSRYAYTLEAFAESLL